MSVTQTFDDATRSLGGRLPREAATDHVRAVLESVEADAQDLIAAARRDLPALPDVHVDFIANSHVNAVAFQADRHYFIGIQAGTVLLLQQVIGRLLADARLFPDIGTPGIERHDLAPLTQSSDALALLAQELPLRPVDAVRQQYAEFLEHQALMFLVGHELAHITCGHVAYLQARRTEPLTVEIGGLTGRGEGERIERQALEQHADTRSIYSRIDSLRFTFTNPNRQVALWRVDATHPVHLLADWALSVHLMFHLFGDVRFTGAALDRTPYPPLAVRRLAGDMLALSAVQRLFGVDVQPFALHALKRARRETNIAVASLFGRVVEPDITTAEEEALQAHARRLNACLFEELVPVLRPFAHEPM